MLANIWTDVCVRSNVLLQHAGLLTADATLPTFVLSPAATSHVNVFLLRLKPKKGEQENQEIFEINIKKLV